MNQPPATQLRKLYTEINTLHAENMDVAKRVAENVVTLGIRLWQLKEAVGHGNFLPSLKDNCPDLAQTTCANYMRLAREMVIAEQTKLLISGDAKQLTAGEDTKLATVANLKDASTEEAEAAARKAVDEMSWLELPFQVSELVQEIQGKQITEVYREYGVIREKKAPKHTPPKEASPEEKLQAAKQAAETAVRTLIGDIHLHVLESDVLGLVPKDLQRELLEAGVELNAKVRGILGPKRKTKKPKKGSKQ